MDDSSNDEKDEVSGGREIDLKVFEDRLATIKSRIERGVYKKVRPFVHKDMVFMVNTLLSFINGVNGKR